MRDAAAEPAAQQRDAAIAARDAAISRATESEATIQALIAELDTARGVAKCAGAF